MRSLRSRAIIFAVRHRHLFSGHLHPQVITPDSDTRALRVMFEEGARRFGRIPESVQVTPERIDGIQAEWVRPSGADPATVLLFAHGGGYVAGSCADHRVHVAKIAQAAGMSALSFDYRLAPEHKAPAAVEDALTVYQWLLARGTAPSRIGIVGVSAGGGLAIATLVAARDRGLPLPAAAVVSSPWLDLTCSADSYRRNAHRDISILGSWDVWNRHYVQDGDPRHPWISPVYADLRGLPPTLVQVGTHEIMLDDAVRFGESARKAGVAATVRVWDGMVHCFAFFAPAFPEATAGMQELAGFLKERLGRAAEAAPAAATPSPAGRG
jgi:acetyl esterase/lipase